MESTLAFATASAQPAKSRPASAPSATETHPSSAMLRNLDIEIVDQAGDRPQHFIRAETSRVRTHRSLDGQHVFAQAVALNPFTDQVPGFVSGRCRHVGSLGLKVAGYRLDRPA